MTMQENHHRLSQSVGFITQNQAARWPSIVVSIASEERLCS